MTLTKPLSPYTATIKRSIRKELTPIECVKCTFELGLYPQVPSVHPPVISFLNTQNCIWHLSHNALLFLRFRFNCCVYSPIFMSSISKPSCYRILPSTQTRWHANAWWKCKLNCIWNRIIKHWNCCRQPLVVKRNTREMYCMCSCAGIGLHEAVVKRWRFISTHTNTTIPRGFALPHSTTQLDRVKMKPAATFPETKATFSRAMRRLWTN